MFAKGLALCVGIAVAVEVVSLAADAPFGGAPVDEKLSADAGVSSGGSADSGIVGSLNLERYPEELTVLLERNEEAFDYMKSYPDREEYLSQAINLAQDFHAGEVPLLMQWDRRWGYDAYGDGMIVLAGCGPVCLNMAYLYFTGNTSMIPREMAACI